MSSGLTRVADLATTCSKRQRSPSCRRLSSRLNILQDNSTWQTGCGQSLDLVDDLLEVFFFFSGFVPLALESLLDESDFGLSAAAAFL